MSLFDLHKKLGLYPGQTKKTNSKAKKPTKGGKK
jgi:hypothetical protein